MTMKELTCPACDSKSFSWEVTQTQYGSVLFNPDTDRTYTEALSSGPITDGPEMVYCRECGRSYDPDGLIPDTQNNK